MDGSPFQDKRKQPRGMTVYISLGVLIFVGTLCQGTIGFGLGTIATPSIAMVAPELVPTVILVRRRFPTAGWAPSLVAPCC